MRGRRPKPAGMSTRRPERSEYGPPAELPDAPEHLDGEALAEWHRIGAKLLTYGLVSEIDSTALAIYCQAWARWVEAEAQLAKFGTVIIAQSGFPVQSPYLSIANKAMEQMQRLLVEFGMTPSSRARVPMSTPIVAEPAPLAIEQPTADPRRFLT